MDKISIIYQRVEPNEEHEESSLNVKVAFEHKKPPENENTKEQLLENCATHIPKQVQISDRFTNLECREHREYDNSSIHNYCGFLGVNRHKFPNPYFNKEGQILAVDSNSDVDKWRSQYRNIAKHMNSASCVLRYEISPIYSRPPWPFLPWKESNGIQDIDPDVFRSMFDTTFDPHAEKKRSVEEDILNNVLNEDSSKINHAFIDYLFEENKKSSSKEKCPEYNRIVSDVRKMVEITYDLLGKKYKVFQDYSIIEMGSVSEGTKIGRPDEFDFMIELPHLNDAIEVLDPPLISPGDSEKRRLRVKKRELFDDLTDFDIDEEKDEDFLKNLWNTIQIEAANTLEKNVLPNWKWLDTVPCYMSKLAQTQTLVFSGQTWDRLIVHIDICICFQPLQYKSNMEFNQDELDKTRPGISTGGNKKTMSNPEYLILRFDSQARWTRAVREKEIWRMYSSENGRKIVYRCMKFAVLKFLPRKYSQGLFRIDPLVSSYWIKTILFYIMTYYPEEKLWNEEQLTLRFVEVFLILRKCLVDKNLSSFFVPHNVLSTFFPKFVRNKEHEEEYENICVHVNELYDLILAGNSNLQDASAYTTILQKLEKISREEQEQGVFKSVIELLYFYAYNDFSEKNLKALQSFTELFMRDKIVLKGEGPGMEVWYKNSKVDINSNISEYYDDEKLYFT